MVWSSTQWRTKSKAVLINVEIISNVFTLHIDPNVLLWENAVALGNLGLWEHRRRPQQLRMYFFYAPTKHENATVLRVKLIDLGNYLQTYLKQTKKPFSWKFDFNYTYVCRASFYKSSWSSKLQDAFFFPSAA